MREAERGLLLLCCALGEAVEPLKRREYNLVMRLLEQAEAPGKEENVSVELLCRLGLSEALAERVLRLLERPHQPQRYLQAQPEVSALTRITPQFPQRLRKLGDECPPAIFCKGDLSLLAKPAVSVVGSRLLGDRGAAFAHRVGRLAAQEGYVLVSGNAAGADRVAQEACLEAGGNVISVIPDALERCPLRERQLFVCDEGYELDFSPARALRRNHLIHALGEKVFVAQCPQTSGGTWSGSRDNLKRGLSPLYVLKDESEGVRALQELGAVPVEDQIPSLRDLQPTQLSIFD